MDLNLKLHVYNGRKIVKTYETNAVDIELGTVEDIAQAMHLDAMTSGDVQEIMTALVCCVAQVRPFLCDMFDGLTMEEARHTRTKNIAEVFQGLFAWFTSGLNDAVSENKKK